MPGYRRLLALAAWACLTAWCAGCAAAPDPAARRRAALDLAAKNGLVRLPESRAALPVLALGRDGPGPDLVVYIEGDGRAFRDRSTPSADPTPGSPVALRLALLDPAPKVVYLGRPCQYAAPLPTACRQALWTGARFGPEAVAAMTAALDAAKTATGAERLHLVGYSGGGAMAVLLAAGRSDVADLVTVAGNLDTEAFAAWHDVTPLAASTNPMTVAPAVAGLPQVHVSGAKDTICPPFLADRFLARLGRPPTASHLTVPGADHHQGFEAVWPRLLDAIRRSPPVPSRPGAFP